MFHFGQYLKLYQLGQAMFEEGAVIGGGFCEFSGLQIAYGFAQRHGVVAACRDDGSLDGVDFRHDILPKLQHLPVRVIADAMGASISHGSKVRGGKLVPHKSVCL
jgi:hypothetical protein